jgi:plasmid stability protein
MADQDARMVLRTVYLPPEVDERLRIGAFRAGRSKNELIRDALTQFLAESGKTQQVRDDGASKVAHRKAMAKRKIAHRKAALKQKVVKATAAAG